jgi:hypothetical protein
MATHTHTQRKSESERERREREREEREDGYSDTIGAVMRPPPTELCLDNPHFGH